MCNDIIPDRHVYVMAVLSGARVVRALCVCVCVCGYRVLRGHLVLRRGCSRVCTVVYDPSW